MAMIRLARRSLLAGAALLLGAAGAPAPAYDLVIRNGRVIDGSGKPAVAADVAIKGGRVARVGRIKGDGVREIDARGLYVSTGWIDMLDQSGGVLTKNGEAANKLRMGVTTLLGGEAGTPVPAAQVAGWFDTLEAEGIAVNFGSYYGTTQARMEVIGDKADAPTPAQLEAMKGKVATAMEAGALGVANALIYPPASFQSTEELIALATVAGRYGGVYGSHIRDESGGLLTAIDEAIRIGETARIPVEVFHFKGAYQPGWGKLLPQAVARIEAARARGLDIAADVYPYTAGGTGLDATLPGWVFRDGLQQVGAKLADPATRERIKRDVAAGSQPGWANLVEASGGWSGVILANPHSAAFDRFKGQSIAEIARQLGRDPTELSWEIMAAARPNRAQALFNLIHEGDLRTALRQPWTSIGSDAAASMGEGQVDALGLPHPRAYGTFPRIVAEYVKRRRLLTLEEAIRKMTGWPAERMRLKDRGLLRQGQWADITVFDLEKLDDVADWAAPTASPVGIEYVLVNGVPVLERGRLTGARPGRVVRGPGFKTTTKP